MPPANLVEVVIYDAPTAATSGCGCGCGGHGHAHGHRHDDDPLSRVKVEYVNVLKDSESCQLPQAKLLCSLAYPTPLVYINGRGRFAGAIPVERVREEVERLLGIS